MQANQTETDAPRSLDPLVSGRLNAEQIKNWRNVLLGMIGPWALMMPDEDVQKMRDEMQRHLGDDSANDGSDAPATKNL
jgi:hypothetical protein